MSVMADARPYTARPARPGSDVRYTILKSYLGYVALARTAKGLAAAFILGSAVFVHRSFYGMRIKSEA